MSFWFLILRKVYFALISKDFELKVHDIEVKSFFNSSFKI